MKKHGGIFFGKQFLIFLLIVVVLLIALLFYNNFSKSSVLEFSFDESLTTANLEFSSGYLNSGEFDVVNLVFVDGEGKEYYYDLFVGDGGNSYVVPSTDVGLTDFSEIVDVKIVGVVKSLGDGAGSNLLIDEESPFSPGQNVLRNTTLKPTSGGGSSGGGGGGGGPGSSPTVTPACVPQSCAVLGLNCGMQTNNCGSVVDCGVCGSSEINCSEVSCFYVTVSGAGNCSISSPCNLSYAKANAVPGSTIYLDAGDYGSVSFISTNAVGNSSAWIVYKGWPGKSTPHFDYLNFSKVIRNYYLIFDGIEFDPGFVDEPLGEVINLHGVDYMKFRNSYIGGEKVASAGINQGDFSPYVYYASFGISSGDSPARSSYITVENCTFREVYRGMYIVSHPNSPTNVKDWVIRGNDFGDCGEDCLSTSVSGGHNISNNYFHDHVTSKAPYCWAGFSRGDWSNRIGQKITQEGTGASGVIYEVTSGSSTCGGYPGEILHIYADDSNNIPIRNVAGNWILDSDSRVYFILPTRIYWNGTISSEWSNHYFENMTQEVTGARGVLGLILGARFYVIPHSEAYLGGGFGSPSLEDYTWVLDSNPSIYFTPTSGYSGVSVEATGDNAHGDFMGIQGSSHDIIVENNTFNQTVLGAQTIKIESGTTNVIFRNNLIFAKYTGAYQMLIGGFNVRIYNNTIDIFEGSYSSSSFRSLVNLGFTDSEVYLEGNIIDGAVYSSGTVHASGNIWGSSPPAQFGESAGVSDFSNIFVSPGNDYRVRSGSVACLNGIVRYGHLAGSSCVSEVGGSWVSGNVVGEVDSFEFWNKFLSWFRFFFR